LVKFFTCFPRTTVTSAQLLSGRTNNHAVVDRPQRELKIDEDQFADLGKIGLPVLIR